MRVMVKPVDGALFFRDIADEDSLADMQEIVGGNIELIAMAAWFPSLPGVEQIDCFGDEEAKLKEGWIGRINFYLGEGENAEADSTVGTVFFCSHNGEGDNTSLTDKQVRNICDHFGWKVPVAA